MARLVRRGGGLRRATELTIDLPRQSGRSKPDGSEIAVRRGALSQVLPGQRLRRHRPDAAPRRQDPRLRGRAAGAPCPGLDSRPDCRMTDADRRPGSSTSRCSSRRGSRSSSSGWRSSSSVRPVAEPVLPAAAPTANLLARAWLAGGDGRCGVQQLVELLATGYRQHGAPTWCSRRANMLGAWPGLGDPPERILNSPLPPNHEDRNPAGRRHRHRNRRRGRSAC